MSYEEKVLRSLAGQAAQLRSGAADHPKDNPSFKDSCAVNPESVSMKTSKEVKAKIREIKDSYKHVLTGSVSTVFINAPRALEQIAAETKL